MAISKSIIKSGLKEKVLVISDLAEEIHSNFEVCLWNSQKVCNNRNVFSIIQYIEKNDIYFKNKYTSWIYEISLRKLTNGKGLLENINFYKGFSYWWLTSFIEQSILKSPRIFDIIKIFALEKILEEREINKVILYSNDHSLKEVIKNLCKSRRINVQTKSSFVKISKGYLRQHIIFEVLKAFFLILKFSIIIRYRKPSFDIKNSDKKSITLFSYINETPLKKESSKHTSKYWGDLQEILKKYNYESSWVFLSNSINQRDITRNSNFIKKGVSNGLFTSNFLLEDFLNFKAFLFALKLMLRVVNRKIRIRNVNEIFFSSCKTNKYSFWPLAKTDWNSSLSGTNLVLNCIYFSLIREQLKNLPEQELGLYLMENQSWERALIYLWKSHNHKQLYGVAHTFIRFWDLRYFSHPGFSGFNQPQPDKIVLNGKYSHQMMHKTFPDKKFEICEALRYNHFLLKGVKRNYENKNKQINLLVLFEFSEERNKQIIDIILKFLKLSDLNFKIYFKSHPGLKVKITEKKLIKFHEYKGPIDNSLIAFDYAITGSLSVACLDAYLMNIKIGVLLNNGSFNFSPLRNIKDVFFFSNEKDMGTLFKEDLQESMLNSTAFFCVDEKLSRWGKLLK